MQRYSFRISCAIAPGIKDATISVVERVACHETLPLDTLYVPKESIEAYKAMPAYAEAFAQIKPLEEAPLPTSCQRPLAPTVQIATADGVLNVTAEGVISIYDLTGTLRSSGSNTLRVIGTTGETLLVVIQGRDTTFVRKVVLR